MTFMGKPKRKNDEAPRFPAWVVVVVALGLVIIAVILFRPAAQNPGSLVAATPEDFSLTATYLIQQATDQVQSSDDPLLLTATALIQEATNQVQSGDDPVMLTATAIIQQATAQATP